MSLEYNDNIHQFTDLFDQTEGIYIHCDEEAINGQ